MFESSGKTTVRPARFFAGAVTDCGFGLLGGLGWTELAKENQTGTAGPGASLVPRSNPGHTFQLFVLHTFLAATC